MGQRTEAISLRMCRAESAKSLSVGPSGPESHLVNISELIPEEDLLYDVFPENFMWGAGTSAYQVNYGKRG